MKSLQRYQGFAIKTDIKKGWALNPTFLATLLQFLFRADPNP
jgi:hypothetical protein